MGKITYIDEKAPHVVCESLCVSCLHRWLGVFPADTPLRLLECPHCHEQGYVIKTGQDLDPYELPGEEVSK